MDIKYVVNIRYLNYVFSQNKALIGFSTSS